jgi:hypothetical protein
MGLLYHFRIDKTSETKARPHDVQKGLINNLINCVDAIKAYLDGFLALEEAVCTYLPLEEWLRLIATFFTFYKLSVGPRDVPDWDPELCRHSADLEVYLRLIAKRLRAENKRIDVPEAVSDSLYQVLPDILESARESYTLARDSKECLPANFRVHIDLTKPIRKSVEGPKITQSVTTTDKICPMTTSITTSPNKQRRGCPATGAWVNKALLLDNNCSWDQVNPHEALTPSAQLVANDRLWCELLATYSNGT